MKKYILAATTVALTLFGLSSCSSDNEMDLPPVETGEVAIDFRSLVDKSTRTAITTEDNIASFTVTGWWHQSGTKKYGDTDTGRYLFNGFNIARGEHSNNEWDYSPKRYWPADGKGTVDFFAYSPASSVHLTKGLEGFEGDPIEYTVPKVGEKTPQEDFLVAKLLGKNSGSVELNFKHALSRVKFFAKSTAPTGVTYIVTGIELVNLFPSGKLDYVTSTFPDGTPGFYDGTKTIWTTSGTITDYPVDMSEAPVYLTGENASLLGVTGAMMVMPQTTRLYTNTINEKTTDFALKVSYQAYANGVYYAGSADASKVKYFPVKQPGVTPDKAITFEMGRQYNFYLTFGEEVGGKMIFDVAVSDWDDAGGQFLPELDNYATLLSDKLVKVADKDKDNKVTHAELVSVTNIPSGSGSGSDKINFETTEDFEGFEYFVNVKTISFANSFSFNNDLTFFAANRVLDTIEVNYHTVAIPKLDISALPTKEFTLSVNDYNNTEMTVGTVIRRADQKIIFDDPGAGTIIGPAREEDPDGNVLPSSIP